MMRINRHCSTGIMYKGSPVGDAMAFGRNEKVVARQPTLRANQTLCKCSWEHGMGAAALYLHTVSRLFSGLVAGAVRQGWRVYYSSTGWNWN